MWFLSIIAISYITKKSVTEIALETGYLHTGNLSEQFKQQTGMTPLQYRKSNIYTPNLP
ncbi:MAG: helix-turn-helix domain-containing protein [Lachnospiraceae bacterium]|nr:helix-turn-helix domain-containing protein [Lachnospiraceae bacterium]